MGYDRSVELNVSFYRLIIKTYLTLANKVARNVKLKTLSILLHLSEVGENVYFFIEEIL